MAERDVCQAHSIGTRLDHHIKTSTVECLTLSPEDAERLVYAIMEASAA